MARGINEWFSNREGGGEGVDGCGDDEPLQPGNEDWLERGLSGREPKPLNTKARASDRHGESRGQERLKRKPENRAHPDTRRTIVDAVRREAARSPHWNARSIAIELKRRGILVEAADVAQITGRALTAAAPLRPTPVKPLSASAKKPAKKNGPTPPDPGIAIGKRKWTQIAARLYAMSPPRSVKSIAAELRGAGFPTVTQSGVKRALAQRGLLRPPPRTTSPRKRMAARNGRSKPIPALPPVPKCSACSGSIDVLGHCACS